LYAKFHGHSFKSEGDMTISFYQFEKIAGVGAVAAAGMLRT